MTAAKPPGRRFICSNMRTPNGGGYFADRNCFSVHTQELTVLTTARYKAVNGGFHDYWQANSRDGLYDASALVDRSVIGAANRHVSEGIKVYGNYSVSKAI